MEVDVVAGAGLFVMWDGGQAATCMGFLLAWSLRESCGMSRGTAGTVPPARGVQLVLIVGAAAAEVEPDVKLDMKLDVAAGVVRLAV